MNIEGMRITHDAEANAAHIYLVDEIGRGEVARNGSETIQAALDSTRRDQ